MYSKKALNMYIIHTGTKLNIYMYIIHMEEFLLSKFQGPFITTTFT